MTEQLDLRLYLVEAIVSNPKLEKLISAQYQKHKFRAYTAAKNSDLYSHPIINDGDIEKEVLSKRILGLILLNEESPEEFSPMLSELFKVGWPDIFSKIDKLEKTNSEVKLQEFVKNSKAMNDDQFNGRLVIAYILANSRGLKFVEDDFFQKLIATFFERTNYYLVDSHSKLRYSSFKLDEINQGKKLLQRIEDKYPDIFINADYLIKKSNDMDLELCKMVSYNQFIFDLEDILFTKIVDSKIDRKLLNQLAALYYMLNKNFNVDTALKFLIPGYIQLKTLQAIKNTKKFYFEHNDETMYFEMEKHENEIAFLNDQIRFNQKTIAQLESENALLKKEYKSSFEKEILSLKKELENTSKALAEAQEMKNELAALRSFVYQSSNDFVPGTNADLLAGRSTDLKGIVIGGHPSWQSSLKEKFPSFEMVSGDGDSKHLLDHVLEYDLVLFNTAYLGHPFYIKVIEKIRHSNIPFGYIQHNNLDIASNEIYTIINNSIKR